MGSFVFLKKELRLSIGSQQAVCDLLKAHAQEDENLSDVNVTDIAVGL